MSRHGNTLKCTTPNDIYLLLKSSSFVSHDLEYAFDDVMSLSNPPLPFNPVLVLRPYFNIHPTLEFRCFVKQRTLVGVCQRDLNHNQHMRALKPLILSKIDGFFNQKLRYDFPDPSFVFDVYLPEKRDGPAGSEVLDRPRLIDINPWAPRTDSLLFSWKELLDVKVPSPVLGTACSEQETVEIRDMGNSDGPSSDDNDDEEHEEYKTDVRLVEKDDASAYNFSSPQYSAHKLPLEIVEAGLGNLGGLRELADSLRELTEGQLR
jgi:D123